MTRVLQPQRDIDREKGGEREREREREKEGEREREQGLLLLVLRHYIARQYTGLWREAVFKVFCAICFLAASKIT